MEFCSLGPKMEKIISYFSTSKSIKQKCGPLTETLRDVAHHEKFFLIFGVL